MRFVPNCASFRTCFYAVCGWKPSSRYVVSASLSARLRRERKADEKTERFNRMLDVCMAAEDFLGAERIFQRLVILGTLVVSFGLLIADMVVDFLATVFALLFWWYDWGMLQAFRGTSSICRFFILDTKKTPEKYFRIKCILADTKTQ